MAALNFRRCLPKPYNHVNTVDVARVCCTLVWKQGWPNPDDSVNTPRYLERCKPFTLLGSIQLQPQMVSLQLTTEIHHPELGNHDTVENVRERDGFSADGKPKTFWTCDLCKPFNESVGETAGPGSDFPSLSTQRNQRAAHGSASYLSSMWSKPTIR
jgi:hypothetical protein